MPSLPPLPALRSFEAVARLGSITQAAHELHVTHSAISQQIKLLEQLIGASLFSRVGRRMVLNEEGRLYALQVRRALEDLGEATRLLRDRPGKDELVIAVLPSFGQQWLLPRLPRFQARFPHYRIRLQASLSIQDIRRESIDLAIRMGQGSWEGMLSQKLFDDELLMVASPQLNGGVLPSSPSEVLQLPLIHSSEPWLRWCERAGVAEPAAEGGLWINDSNLVLEAVRRGQGIALERRSLVQDALLRGELVQLTSITAPYPFPYWLVWAPREASCRKQADFSEWLQAEVTGYLAIPE
jgi:LysR family glycine cleavage system transcriptional activator